MATSASRGIERVELFDAHNGGVGDLVLFAVVAEIIVNFTRAKDEAFGAVRSGGLLQNFVKMSGCEILQLRCCRRVAQQRLG